MHQVIDAGSSFPVQGFPGCVALVLGIDQQGKAGQKKDKAESF
jgi:hypothetical protein